MKYKAKETVSFKVQNIIYTLQKGEIKDLKVEINHPKLDIVIEKKKEEPIKELKEEKKEKKEEKPKKRIKLKKAE